MCSSNSSLFIAITPQPNEQFHAATIYILHITKNIPLTGAAAFFLDAFAK